MECEKTGSYIVRHREAFSSGVRWFFFLFSFCKDYTKSNLNNNYMFQF